jgi:hypothetical protein
VLALFERWNAERLLLKRSGTRKGAGVTVFDRAGVDSLEWQPPLDVFCPELDPDTGTVYKPEMFNGRLVIAWQWRYPPLREGFSGHLRAGDRPRAGRRLFRFPPDLDERIRGLSQALTEGGFGYCSLDLMRTQGGELVVIELNDAQVATWWTARFPRTKWRYAAAVGTLVSKL